MGVRKSFVRGFADAFSTVRERSLSPLVADGGYDTVANLERAVKQLTFTSLSETVARKVCYVSVTLSNTLNYEGRSTNKFKPHLTCTGNVFS